VPVSAASTRWYDAGTCRALQHLGEGSEINLKDHFVAETGAEYPIAQLRLAIAQHRNAIQEHFKESETFEGLGDAKARTETPKSL